MTDTGMETPLNEGRPNASDCFLYPSLNPKPKLSWQVFWEKNQNHLNFWSQRWGIGTLCTLVITETLGNSLLVSLLLSFFLHPPICKVRTNTSLTLSQQTGPVSQFQTWIKPKKQKHYLLCHFGKPKKKKSLNIRFFPLELPNKALKNPSKQTKKPPCLPHKK